MSTFRLDFRWAFFFLASASLASNVFSAGPDSSKDLLGTLRAALDSSGEGNLNAGNCGEILSAWSQQAASVDAQQIIEKKNSRPPNKAAAEFQAEVFSLRLKLREITANLTVEDRRKCLNPLRRTYTTMRGLEEVASEWRAEHSPAEKSSDPNGTPFEDNSTSTNPKFNNWDFKAGDIIIERGTDYTSALISRLSDESNLFSHLILVGKDKQGKLYIVQAEGETDVRTTPLEEWLRSPNHNSGARLALYRSRDQKVAEKAARFAYETVHAREEAGNPIRYDFHMNSHNRSELYCAELAQWAYERASRGAVHLPEFETTLHKYECKNLDFLNEMQIPVRQWFAPADIDVDPRFELVAEYRDKRKIRAATRADAISDAMIKWATKDNYELKQDPLLWMVAQTAVNLKQIVSLLPFSDRTPPGFAKVVLQTDEIAEIIQTKLTAIDEGYFRKTGKWMTTAQLTASIEKIRRDDCRTFLQRGQFPLGIPSQISPKLIHDNFAPTNRSCQA